MKKTLLLLPFFLKSSLVAAMAITPAEHIKRQIIQFQKEGVSKEELARLSTNALREMLEYSLLYTNEKKYMNLYRTLVEAGGNKNVQHPKNGKTALMFAALDGRPDICAALLDLGVDYKIADADGNTLKDLLDSNISLLNKKGKDEISELLKEAEIIANAPRFKIH